MAPRQSLTKDRDSVIGDVFTASEAPVVSIPTAGKDLFGFCNSNVSPSSKANPVSNLLKPENNPVNGGLYVGQASGLTNNECSHQLNSIQEASTSDSNYVFKSWRPAKFEQRDPLEELFVTHDTHDACALADAGENYLRAKSSESWPALHTCRPESHFSKNQNSHFPNRSDEVDHNGHTPWLKAVKPYCPERLAREKWPSLSEAGPSLELFRNVTSHAGGGKASTEVVSSFSCGDERNRACCEDIYKKHNNSTNSFSRSRLAQGWKRNALCKYSVSELEGSIAKQKQILRSVLVDNLGSKRCGKASDGRGTIPTILCKKEGKSNTNYWHSTQPMPAVLLMLNTDFIVTSPLKENLLLTLALTPKTTADPRGRISECEETTKVLVGQFIAFSSFIRVRLGHDARRVATERNAGGTSTISESLSVEYFVRRFQARNVVTEMEVEYCSANWKKVDYICNLYGKQVGVSVTRAMSYPNPEDFSPQMAYRLLYKKLYGLSVARSWMQVVARHGVTARHSFSQCVLHVWCETKKTAKIMEAEYKEVAKELDVIDEVIMILTVAEGWHARSIFYESCVEK